MLMKKILIASFFTVIMLITPFAAATVTPTNSANSNGNIGTISPTGGSTGSNGDNRMGWIRNAKNHALNIYTTAQPIFQAAGYSIDTLLKWVDLVKNFGNWNEATTLREYFSSLITYVKSVIITIQSSISLIVYFTTDFITQWNAFLNAVNKAAAWWATIPYNKPITIHGTVFGKTSSGSQKLLPGARVKCNGVSTTTDSFGYYEFYVKAIQPFSSYLVSAMETGYIQSSSTYLFVFPEAVITVNLVLPLEGTSYPSSSTSTSMNSVISNTNLVTFQPSSSLK